MYIVDWSRRSLEVALYLDFCEAFGVEVLQFDIARLTGGL